METYRQAALKRFGGANVIYGGAGNKILAAALGEVACCIQHKYGGPRDASMCTRGYFDRNGRQNYWDLWTNGSTYVSMTCSSSLSLGTNSKSLRCEEATGTEKSFLPCKRDSFLLISRTSTATCRSGKSTPSRLWTDRKRPHSVFHLSQIFFILAGFTTHE